VSTARAPAGLLLLAIVAGGTALRAYRLDWGLPGHNFPDDVMHFLRPAARAAASGSWLPLPDAFIHGPVLIGLLAATFRVWAIATGTTIQPPPLGVTPQLETLTLVGRALNVGIAALSIVMLYLVARRLVGRAGALLAAAALAFSPLHVLESHRLAPDIPGVLFLLVALWLGLVADERRSTALLAAGGVVAGIAIATRYTTALALAGPLLVLARRQGGGAVAALGTATLGGFLLGALPILARPQRFASDVGLIAVLGYGVDAPGVTLADGLAQQRWVYPLAVALPYMMGWALYLLAAAGLWALWRRDRRVAAVVLAGLVPFLVLIGASRAAVPRYYLPVLPFLAIGAGAAVAVSASPLVRGIGVAAVAYTVLLATAQARRLRLEPQHEVGVLTDRLVQDATAAHRTPLVVAYPSRIWLHYDAVAREVRRPDVTIVEFPPAFANPFADATGAPAPADWLAAEHVDAVVVPSWIENAVNRMQTPGVSHAFLRALADGSLGFREAGDFRTRYPTEWLYTWGDPMLDTHWETAIAGYRVYVRDRTADRG
jgi:hypothetical protein